MSLLQSILDKQKGKVTLSKKATTSSSAGPVDPHAKVLSSLQASLDYLKDAKVTDPIPKVGSGDNAKPVVTKTWKVTDSGSIQLVPKLGNVTIFFDEETCKQSTFFEVKNQNDFIDLLKDVISSLSELTPSEVAFYGYTSAYVRDANGNIEREGGRKAVEKDSNGKAIKKVRKITYDSLN